MNDTAMQTGFFAGAAFNIVGMAVFSKALTNTVLFETDPAMFSKPACVLVMIWGLAYAAQARSWRSAPGVSGVFAIEKLFFAGWWAVWMAGHSAELGAIAQRDPLAAAFYGAYGIGDGAFMLFFGFAAFRALPR